MQIAKFTFKLIGKEYLGIIWRPYATILVQSKDKKWLPIEMVIDTGADYTLFPRRYAELLGINILDCIPKTSLGIGGSETVYLYKSVKIKINEWQRRIPVGFLERDDIPALLGRLECIEVLKVTFENFETKFEK